MNIILFLAGVFLVTFFVGRLLERIHIPWIFSAMLIGLGLAAYNPFIDITNSPSFLFLAELGMYFLLFIIGFEIDINEMRKQKSFIIKTTIAIVFTEAFFGMLFIHYIFDISWIISALVALSFATVGEAVLIPILDEFKLTKTKLGQSILSIGVLDDVVEILVIIIFTGILGISIGHAHTKIYSTIITLLLMFGFAYFLTKWKGYSEKIQYKGVASFFIFVIFFIFAFIGFGLTADAGAIGALLAGMALKNFIPNKRWKIVDSEVKNMAYGFFAPVFFIWVGLDTDIFYLLKYPLLVIAVILIANATKIVVSYLIGRKILGTKKSVLLGIALTIKFSTSIVIIKLLYENVLIPVTLYSVLIGSTVLFKFIVPLLMSSLIKKWKIKD